MHAGYPAYMRDTILSFLGVNAQWKEAFWFFQHYGYKVSDILDSAKVMLDRFVVPDYVIDTEKKALAYSITTDVLKENEVTLLLEFLKETFPDDWYTNPKESVSVPVFSFPGFKEPL